MSGSLKIAMTSIRSLNIGVQNPLTTQLNVQTEKVTFIAPYFLLRWSPSAGAENGIAPDDKNETRKLSSIHDRGPTDRV